MEFVISAHALKIQNSDLVQNLAVRRRTTCLPGTGWRATCQRATSREACGSEKRLRQHGGSEKRFRQHGEAQ